MKTLEVPGARRGEQKNSKKENNKSRSKREGPEETRRDPQERPEGRQSHPRDSQEEEKGADETPKTLSIPSSAAKRRFMQNAGFPIVKPRFSRLGGSIWELNIDTKRLQEDSGGLWSTERRPGKHPGGLQGPLASDYELPNNSDGHRPCVELAAI